MRLTELTRKEHELLLEALHLKINKIEECLHACKRTDVELRDGVPPAAPHVVQSFERDLRATRALYEDVRRAGLCD